MMRKLIYIILGCVLFFPACHKKQDGSKAVVIGLSVPSETDERWVRDIYVLKRKVSELGAELYVSSGDSNAALQMSRSLQMLKAVNPSVLIIASQDREIGMQMSAKAHEAGAKVIAYEWLLPGKDVDFYLSFDYLGIGRKQARYLNKVVNGGNYVFFYGAEDDNNYKFMKQGAMEILKPLAESGHINLIADKEVSDWNADDAARKADSVLKDYSDDVQAFLVSDDVAAGGVITALAWHGLAGKVPVTGESSSLAAVQRVARGTQLLTIFKDSQLLASTAVDAAVSMSVGGTPPSNTQVNNGTKDVPALLLDTVIIDKGNINLLVQSGYLTAKQIYGKEI